MIVKEQGEKGLQSRGQRRPVDEESEERKVLMADVKWKRSQSIEQGWTTLS